MRPVPFTPRTTRKEPTPLNREELVAAAMHAATHRNLYPDTTAHPPEVTEGDAASTVLMTDHNSQWIVCVHPHGHNPGNWYVTGHLPPGIARQAAADYAATGL